MSWVAIFFIALAGFLAALAAYAHFRRSARLMTSLGDRLALQFCAKAAEHRREGLDLEDRAIKAKDTIMEIATRFAELVK